MAVPLMRPGWAPTRIEPDERGGNGVGRGGAPDGGRDGSGDPSGATDGGSDEIRGPGDGGELARGGDVARSGGTVVARNGPSGRGGGMVVLGRAGIGGQDGGSVGGRDGATEMRAEEGARGGVVIEGDVAIEGREGARGIDDDGRSPAARIRSSSRASRRSGSNSRGDAMRANELLRRHAETT